MDNLIQIVARRAGITHAAATLAIEATLDYMAARHPGLTVGHIREQLRAEQDIRPASDDEPRWA